MTLDIFERHTKGHFLGRLSRGSVMTLDEAKGIKSEQLQIALAAFENSYLGQYLKKVWGEADGKFPTTFRDSRDPAIEKVAQSANMDDAERHLIRAAMLPRTDAAVLKDALDGGLSRSPDDEEAKQAFLNRITAHLDDVSPNPRLTTSTGWIAGDVTCIALKIHKPDRQGDRSQEMADIVLKHYCEDGEATTAFSPATMSVAVAWKHEGKPWYLPHTNDISRAAFITMAQGSNLHNAIRRNAIVGTYESTGGIEFQNIEGITKDIALRARRPGMGFRR